MLVIAPSCVKIIFSAWRLVLTDHHSDATGRQNAGALLERALSRTEKFKEGSDLRAWLFTIMHNVFINQVRKASTKAVHVSVDDESVFESEFAVSANQTQSLEVRDLDYALQRLPADQREVVLLVGLEEMSYTEVALALDIPVGTVMHCVEMLPGKMVMKGDDLVDAALAGLDQGELVTIPSLPDAADWQAYEAARQQLIPNLSLSVPSTRYLAPMAA